MKALGARTYRFSSPGRASSRRISGAPNPKGLDFYSRLVDELLANGIQPFATLYHWTCRRRCRTACGWESRDTSKAFGDYAGYVAER